MSPAMDVQNYYEQNAEAEWMRLERHRTEFSVTMRVLKEFLPPPPALVLDIGGGPGRYAIELAKIGHQVTLLDLSPANLALAKDKARQEGVRLASFLQANALDLSGLKAAAYDSALLMGPLYHLLEVSQRRQAVDEAWRVLKPGGLIFAALISRFAPFRYAARAEPELVYKDWDYAEHLLKTGVHYKALTFTEAYFAHPEEIIPFMEEASFITSGLIGCEGIVSGLEENINSLDGQAWERWVELNYRLGKEPSLHGAAEHLLYIGQKAG
jgi:S-adenosylmethionine-dependent methyltransferase